MYFTDDEEGRIQAAIEQIEARTGVQVLAAVIGKADHYPEAPWKAFALAASLASLVVAIQAALDPPWIAPVQAAVVRDRGARRRRRGGPGDRAAAATRPAPRALGAAGGRGRAVRPRLLPRAGHLRHARADRESWSWSASSSARSSILPDTGLAARLPAGALAAVVAQMRPQLSRGARFAALRAGLAALEQTLLAAGFRGAPGAPDEIPTELTEDRGVSE